ncbi:hypothetical protein M0D69_35540 [Caballeronia sp. SEWSISQ10-4 2]|uniref:hypothetical protein n=1 Tax=Caballeronia sp. SEWSISQ10-4 2 TaxID=2937438 RepID=UPI00264E16FE|nr:hypothetical protein [Caballeronia sp. SEWSISQ10-4 2]MDN7183237.1 hypothetical protein [Caballeronia sp. SEWSISQ10-4 2]
MTTEELDAAYEADKQACRNSQTQDDNPFSFMAEGAKWSDWLSGFNAVFSRLSN